MANSRDYAKGLVGELDRTIYNTQRDVAQRTHQTNWQNLQNQYKNLTEELKTTQEEANRNYANTMANIAGEGFDRMRGYNADLVNRGVAQSGTRDLAQQANIEKKGKLETVQKNYEENEELLEERLVVLYETGDVTFIDILLRSASLIDFLSFLYN